MIRSEFYGLESGTWKCTHVGVASITGAFKKKKVNGKAVRNKTAGHRNYYYIFERLTSDAKAMKMIRLNAKQVRQVRDGWYTFSPDCRDFFFVNKNQVIRTATDKGGGDFFQLGMWLFVIDDMSGSYQNRVRAPWWDELKNKDASVEKKNDQYVYTLFLEDVKKFVTFSIPEKILNYLNEGAVL